MSHSIPQKISNDLKKNQIDWKVIFAFIPIAFLTYLFHEFGHWTFGELLGNDMTLSLNNSAPRDGFFKNDNSALWSAIGGPVFTVLQASIFLLITWVTKSNVAYSIVFFAVFSRFFSIIFGGIDLQDEARIASMLNTSKYLIAAIVLLNLFFILCISTRLMKISIKGIGYYLVLGVVSVIIIIGFYELF